MLSILDIFRIGVGPSSSHTVGPMRIARQFMLILERTGSLSNVHKIQVELQGSLALTGEGHATPKAVLLGLAGHEPDKVSPQQAQASEDDIRKNRRLRLPGGASTIDFDPEQDIIMAYDKVPELHPNAMLLRAKDAQGHILIEKEFFSTGGGFIASREQLERPAKNDIVSSRREVPYPFASAEALLQICADNKLALHEVVQANEDAMRPQQQTKEALDKIASAMMNCIDRGLESEGTLPGSLKMQRRAAALWRKLRETPLSNERERLFDQLNVYAMAVNEENAAGNQVVTAPTNGAAGIIPAIIRYYCIDAELDRTAIHKFLLTAGAIGLLYKQRASISGAEMGCQGEVGVACSMAAGGLAAVWGGSPLQIANAAEVGMEHNLGLTCDPVAGLVQIPCIERNAIGAVKAANAARLALNAPERQQHVSLDQVIETMRQTGLDMSSKYKETSRGGLAVNVVEC